MVYKGNTPTPETIDRYTGTFGDDYFAFWFGGVHFIVINSQFYEDDSMAKVIWEFGISIPKVDSA